MKLKLYQVDAFAGKLFSGNPAAVSTFEKWPDKQNCIYRMETVE
ncbi:MAG: PhzF family phenazine biosynthesis protein [Bacteroidetes bacterium]|nr:PhzF family phenazine biosynthesis protein [Bacteroidota bacterium]